jgi:hypothetical protein
MRRFLDGLGFLLAGPLCCVLISAGCGKEEKPQLPGGGACGKTTAKQTKGTQSVVSSGADEKPSGEGQIEQAIQHMVDGAGHKVDMRPRINTVVAFGDAAVPFLIKTFEKTKDENCWPVIDCLLAIGSDDSLAFAIKVVKEATKPYAAAVVIERFPVAREDEIMSLLLDSMRVSKLHYNSSERLKKMIDRKPLCAGQLVRALKDDGANDAYDSVLGEILAFVSGYSNLWGAKMSPNSEPVRFTNTWWREWWNRNKDRDVFGWLEESINVSEDHKSTVLQRMWAIKDKRALPYFLKALDSPLPSVQYWGVVGLQGLDESFRGKELPYTGTTYEAFLKEKDGIILELKRKFENADRKGTNPP